MSRRSVDSPSNVRGIVADALTLYAWSRGLFRSRILPRYR